MSELTSSRPASRASPLATLADAWARAIAGGSGPKSHDALGSFDPGGAFLKTCREFFPSTTDVRSEKFSQTWPASGTMRRGLVCPQPTLAPRTSGTASGSWPSPHANAATGAGQQGRDGGANVQTASAAWATPTGRDHKDTGDLTNVPVNSLLGRQTSLFAEPTAA